MVSKMIISATDSDAAAFLSAARGDGITDVIALSMYTDIQAFQTKLGRQFE